MQPTALYESFCLPVTVSKQNELPVSCDDHNTAADPVLGRGFVRGSGAGPSPPEAEAFSLNYTLILDVFSVMRHKFEVLDKYNEQ